MSLLCNLMVVGAFSPSTSASVCHSASLCEFLCVVFCISLPYMAAQSKISEFAKSHELKSRPHAMLWLSKVYGIPAGMYASQVWGTVYLSEGSEFGSQLQKRLCVP